MSLLIQLVKIDIDDTACQGKLLKECFFTLQECIININRNIKRLSAYAAHYVYYKYNINPGSEIYPHECIDNVILIYL